MKREDIIQNLLYGILLSAFLLLYFILSMNSRLVADDFYFLKNFQDHGWWQSMVLSWHSWVTRWSAILWLNSIFSLYLITGNFLFYQIITLLMLCFALYRLSVFFIDFCLKHRLWKSPGLHAIAYLPRHSRFAVSLFISFFFLVPGIGETFFWITSSSMYLWGFIAFCFLMAEVLRGEQTLTSILVCMVTAAFAGGAAEAISIPALFLLIVLVIFQAWEKTFKANTAIAIVFLLASVFVSYYGTGRTLRQSALPAESLPNAFLVTLKSMAKFETYFLKQQVIWAILFFISWMGFAQGISLKIKVKAKHVFFVLFTYLFLFFIFIFPACFLLGDEPPQRALILVGFLNSCIISLGGVLAAAMLRQPALIKTMSSLAVFVLAILIGKLAIEQKTITTVYSRAVDSRMQFLTTLANPDDTTAIILEPLPDSGLLMSSEISPDPGDFRNQHLKNYLRMQTDLQVK